MKQLQFDVLVVGGGHAGTEAALAASRIGASVALVTHRFDRLGEMSCNPAIGGVGKGHLVREIDALDGAMGVAADRAGIQYRLLNRSRGAAVQGPRTQTDRVLYRSAVQTMVRAKTAATVVEGEVVGLIITVGRVQGVELASGEVIRASATVLTTGTFLRGTIHTGNERQPAGRMGDPSAERLARQIEALDLPLGRLKTGTPPRLDKNSIDWSRVGRQEGDLEPEYLSFLTTRVVARQISCGVTATNPRTHAIIRKDLSRSPAFSGAMTGSGPRYCPSIEDKVTRFPEKDAHTVFLEPEGLESDVVYPNGISTSLPADVQANYVRSIAGLENAVITRPGYAIEYDYVDPRAVGMDLRVRTVPGLYLAGQINGTTGYEEAAAQGLLAGLNAALGATGRDPFQLSRSNSYIGVMISDLTSRGVTEPYRMFTSRVELRLSVRADNADQRLTPSGVAIGCVREPRRQAFESKMNALARGRALASRTSFTPIEAAQLGITVTEDGRRRSVLELVGTAACTWEDLSLAAPELLELPEGVRCQLEREARYAPYLDREERDAAMLRKEESHRIPMELDYWEVPGLTSELRQKLSAVRPETLAHAGQIEGMTPSALTIVLLKSRSLAQSK